MTHLSFKGYQWDRLIDEDYRAFGTLYSEEQFAKILQKNPQADSVIFRGQQEDFSFQTTITPEMMISLKQCLPGLKSIRWEGWAHIPWNTCNGQFVAIEILIPTMIDSIHTTDFPEVNRLIFVNTLIGDEDLELLPRNFENLEEIHLIGCEKISDNGLLSLVSLSPKLRRIKLGSLQYSQGYSRYKWTVQNISRYNQKLCLKDKERTL